MFIDDDPFFKIALIFIALVSLVWGISALLGGGFKNDK